MRLFLTLVAVCVLAGCGAHASRAEPHVQSSVTLSPGTCRTLVLGFRGQGQSLRGYDGSGREAGQVAALLPLGDVRMVGVRYPARPGGATYDADVAAGVRAGERALRHACGRVVLVGYSQGAEVVHRLVVAQPGRVRLAVLMGDPLRDPGDAVRTTTLGTGRLVGRGNAGPGARFPDVVRDHVLEVCVQGDDVCNAPLTGRIGPPSQTHRTAYQTLRAARAIVGAAS